MKHILGKKGAMFIIALAIGPTLGLENSGADPSRYPQFAQHQLPKGLAPEFVYLNQLTDEVTAVSKPLIVDVRTVEEYREAHIAGSVSIPLDEFPKRLMEVPKDRLVVLY
jgi:hypothetical protein